MKKFFIASLIVASTSSFAAYWSPYNYSDTQLNAMTIGKGNIYFDYTNNKIRVGNGSTLGGIIIATTTDTAPSVTGLSVASGKTLTISKTMTFTGAGDTSVLTVPTGTKTLVATDEVVSNIGSGTITADMLQDTATDLGAANVTVDLSNSNGSFVTNVTVDGTVTSTGGFSGSLDGTASAVNGLSLTNGKSLTVNNTLTLAGTDSTTMTFPGANATLMANDMSNSTLPICTSTDTQVTAGSPVSNGTITITVGGNSYSVLVVTP